MIHSHMGFQFQSQMGVQHHTMYGWSAAYAYTAVIVSTVVQVLLLLLLNDVHELKLIKQHERCDAKKKNAKNKE